jgi:hypothetical protein
LQGSGHRVPVAVLDGLPLEDEGKDDHPRFQLVDDIRILQVWVAAMYILDAFAELQLRRENKYREIELEPQSSFYAHIRRSKLYQVLRLSGGGIGGQIVLIVKAAQHIDAEIIDPVRKEFDMRRKSQ